MKPEFKRYNGIPRPLQVCIRKLRKNEVLGTGGARRAEVDSV